MRHFQILSEAEGIASEFVNKEFDLSKRIAELAIRYRLSKEQIQRLVEETNKKVLLAQFEATGSQTFPVAETEKVLQHVKPKEEAAFVKQASMPMPTSYMQEKTASTIKDGVYSDTFVAAHEDLLTKTARYIAKYIDQEELYNEMHRSYGGTVKDAELLKVASVNNDSRVVEFKSGISRLCDAKVDMIKAASRFVDHPDFVDYNEAVQAGNFEKTAEQKLLSSMIYGNLNPFSKNTRAMGAWHVAKDVMALPMNLVGLGIGKTIKGTAGLAGATVVGGAKAAAKFAPAALAILPGRSLLDKAFMAPQLKHEGASVVNAAKGMMAPQLIGSAIENGMTKLSSEQLHAQAHAILSTCAQFVPVNALEKHAGWRDGLQHLLDFVAPAATAGWGGIATTAAKKLGGGLAVTMNSRALQKSFDTIMQRNPDFREKEDAIRNYFHVIADNAPSLAKSPIVAESIVKNFDALGTVDFNTIQAMRKTENEGSVSGDRVLPIRL